MLNRIDSHVSLKPMDDNPEIMILSLQKNEVLNAIDYRMLETLKRSISTIKQSTKTKVLIINSNNPRAFCTGINISYVNSLTNKEITEFFTELAQLFIDIEQLNCVTIAVVDGYAYGAGADLALACDIRIGTPEIKIRFPGPQFGLVLGTKRLIAEIGVSRARYLTLTNKVVDGKQAKNEGLIHDLCQSKDLYHKMKSYALKLIKMPQHVTKTIKNLTNDYENNKLIIDLTKNSILANDFKKQLNLFLHNN